MTQNSSLSYNLHGFLEITYTLPLSPLLRRNYNHWGATSAEISFVYPGDQFVPDPMLEYTRAITIQASAAQIWPWLMQIGYGRGGLYSYDRLENLVGCDLHSTETLLEHVPPFKIGDLMRMGPEGYPAMYVLAIQAEKYLLLGNGTDIQGPESVARFNLANPFPENGQRTYWLFYLDEHADGSSRLIVRSRNRYPDQFSQHLIWRITEALNFVMEKAMLQGIKVRVENGK